MIKYIWNFHGGDGKGTAAHHRIHLEAFTATNNIPFQKYKTGQLDINENHSVSYLEIDKQYAQLIEILKPHETVSN